MMKYAVLLLLLLCGSTYAEPPAVGLWEQFRPSDSNGGSNQHRVDFIFTNKPASAGTVFTALSDVGTKVHIICCVQTKSATRLTLSRLMTDYKLADDDKLHLKTVRGLKYIYEANVVPRSTQNRNMRDLIDSMSSPDDLSPYSSAVIAGNLHGDALVQKTLLIDGYSVSLTATSDQGTSHYLFKLEGKRVEFTEDNFPD